MSTRLVVFALVTSFGIPFETTAQPAPSLGKAWSFAVLGQSVTNSGDTLLTGDVGAAGDSNVGKELVRLGAIQPKAAARQALSEAAAVLDRDWCADGPAVVPETLPSGTSCFRSPQLPPILTLHGDANAVWIISVAGDLTAGAKSAVRLTGGAHDWNVFWLVHGDVHLGPHTVFAGSILARGSVTLDAGASLAGRAIALGGAVTLGASSVSVCCPSISVSTALARGFAGTPYLQTLTASGGLSPYRFEVLTGSLPAGLPNLDKGVLSGIPSSGHFPFTVVVTDANRCASVQPETVDVCPLTLSPPPLPRGRVGQPYRAGITATGGSGVYTFTGSNTPDGLELTPDGVLRGIPTKADAWPMFIDAKDGASGCTGGGRYRPVICGIDIRPRGLSGGTVGEPYTASFEAPDAIGEASFSIVRGKLPDGLPGLSPQGEIVGTPTLPGKYVFTVQATDDEACAAEKTYEITIQPRVTCSVLPGALPGGTVGTPYSQTVSAIDGTPNYTFNFTGSLPPGLSLDPLTGLLSGTPKTAGCFRFTIIASDAANHVCSKEYTVCICGTLLFLQAPQLRTATFGVPYRITLGVSGGQGPYRFRVTSGSLPVWLSLSETGVLSGTPGDDADVVNPAMVFTPGNPFTVTATDWITGCPAVSRAFNVPVRVCNASVMIDTTFLPNATRGIGYSEPIAVEGGTAPYSFTIASGALPDGLTLTGGTITGTPTTPGTYCFGIVAMDAGQCSSAPQDYAITVAEPTCPNGVAIIISPAMLQQPVVGVPYFQQLTAMGGAGPYTFGVSSGMLPDGLQLDPATGVISGIPVKSGLYEFTLIAIDRNGCVSNRCAETVTVP